MFYSTWSSSSPHTRLLTEQMLRSIDRSVVTEIVKLENLVAENIKEPPGREFADISVVLLDLLVIVGAILRDKILGDSELVHQLFVVFIGLQLGYASDTAVIAVVTFSMSPVDLRPSAMAISVSDSCLVFLTMV